MKLYLYQDTGVQYFEFKGTVSIINTSAENAY